MTDLKRFCTNRRIIIIICSILLAIAVIGTVVLILYTLNNEEQLLTVRELLEHGEKHLGDHEYEQALAYFIEVIDTDPENSRGYTGAAEAYIGLGRMSDAMAILELGIAKPGESLSIRRMLEDLLDTINRGDGSISDRRPGQADLNEPTSPVNATEQDTGSEIYRAYYEVLNGLVEQHGLSDYSSSIGVWRATLIDLDGDGVDELVVFYTKEYNQWGLDNVSCFDVYGYNSITKGAELIFEYFPKDYVQHGFTVDIFKGLDGNIYTRKQDHWSSGIHGDYYTFENGQWKTVITFWAEELWEEETYIYEINGVENIDEATALREFEQYEALLLFELSGGDWDGPDYINNINDILNILR